MGDRVYYSSISRNFGSISFYFFPQVSLQMGSNLGTRTMGVPFIKAK